MTPATLPHLALIGHGTDASDRLEAGVHLRWAFRREMGFPPGGFCLYRRAAKKRPKICFDVRVEWPRDTGSKRLENAGIVVQLDAVKRGAAASLRISVPSTSSVELDLRVQPRQRADVQALNGRRVVDEGKVAGGGGARIALEAAEITTVVVRGRFTLVQICVVGSEPCDDDRGWEQVGRCPICLPGCRHTDKKHREFECDGGALTERLPKDPCVWEEYSGTKLQELGETIDTLLDVTRGPTMASRFADWDTSNEDCPPPGTGTPQIRISALDVLLMASVDPVIARLLGLLDVDRTAVSGQKYDYRIVGFWPKETLWSLEESTTFDEVDPGTTIPTAWQHENLIVVSSRRMHVQPVMTNFARTDQALAFRPEEVDWIFFDMPDGAPAFTMVRLRYPVCEVQVYARHSGDQLTMRASREGTAVGETSSPRPNCILAFHDEGGFDTLTFEGELDFVFRIDTGKDYIPHGRHCHIAYGLGVETPTPLKVPTTVTATALQGVTRKQSDCEPLGEGELADTRHMVGVRWSPPDTAAESLLVTDPIRFWLEREEPDGTIATVRGDPISVVPSSTAPPGPLLEGWPAERQYVLDIVPYAGKYRYRVKGMDIFGRESDFGPWSSQVKVAAVPPPPPTRVMAKWLDPADSSLTDAEREWLADDARPGLFVRWDWRTEHERQAPFGGDFHVLVQRGWLNVIQCQARAAPVVAAPDAAVFTVRVNFSQPIAADVLAGTTMTRKGVPYHIRTNTAAVAPALESTLECSVPPSGVPIWSAGAEFAVPVVPLIDAVVDQVVYQTAGGFSVRVKTPDLGVAPPSGFVGGTLWAGEERRRIIDASSVGLVDGDLRATLKLQIGELSSWGFYAALNGQRVTIELPPPSPPYVDYRDVANWDAFTDAIPYEGIGTYEVMLREQDPGESIGRDVLGPRQHSIIVDFPPLEDAAKAYAQAAIATRLSGIYGPASSPSAYFRIDRATPAEPAVLPAPGAADMGDLPSTYAEPPGYDGKSRYEHRWPHTQGHGYIVYRAMDETLFAIDRAVRGHRSKVRAHWDAFLNQFPDPEGLLHDLAFNTFIANASVPDYANLAPKNRMLQVLASFPDVEDAFARLNPALIQWDDAEYADRTTKYPGPGEAAYVPQAGYRLFTDRKLPARGTCGFFYRVQAVDTLGNVGKVSTSTPPVWLGAPGAPATPSISQIEPRDRAVVLQWSDDQEATVFLVHRAPNRDAVLASVAAGDPIAVVARAPRRVQDGNVDLGPEARAVTAEHVYDLSELEAAADPDSPLVPADLLAGPIPVADGVIEGVPAADGTLVVAAYTDENGVVQETVWPGRRVRWIDGDCPSGTDVWYTVVAVRDADIRGSAARLASSPGTPVMTRCVDLSEPPAPEWQGIDWVRVDEAGVEHAYGDAAGDAAVRLSWLPVGETDEIAVERMAAGQLSWSTLERVGSDILTYRDEAVDDTVAYRYRLQVRRINGNTNVSAVAELAGN